MRPALVLLPSLTLPFRPSPSLSLSPASSAYSCLSCPLGRLPAWAGRCEMRLACAPLTLPPPCGVKPGVVRASEWSGHFKPRTAQHNFLAYHYHQNIDWFSCPLIVLQVSSGI